MADKAGYRLTAPDRRAYDPTTLEQIYAQKLGNTEYSPGLYLGHMQLAQGDRQMQADQYDRQLNAVNQQQYDLGLKKIEQEAAESADRVVTAGMAQPGGASYFERSRSLMNPGMLPRAVERAAADTQLVESTAFNQQGAGTESLSDAGVSAPMGAVFNPRTGVTNSPMGQGTRPDLVKASIDARAKSAGGGTERLSALVGASRLELDRQMAVVRAGDSAYNNHMARMGAVIDGQGNMIRPPAVNAEKAHTDAEAARARAVQAAERSYGTTQHIYAQGGRPDLLPKTVPNYRLGAEAAPQAPHTAADPGGSGAPTVGAQSAGNPRAAMPEAPKPAPGSAAANANANGGNANDPRIVALATSLKRRGVPDADSVALRLSTQARPPGAARIMVKPDGSAVQYVTAEGQPVGQPIAVR